jgi:predicted protein tyrosine phosphatase
MRRPKPGWINIPARFKGLPISSIQYTDDQRAEPVGISVSPDEAIEAAEGITQPKKSVRERIGNASNDYQGAYKRVLCICSGGLLRSPTAAVVLSQEPYNFNTRSAGLNPDYALNPVDAVLLSWADEIVVMEPEMTEQIRELLKGVLGGKQIICLNIPDLFSYRDSELMELIRTRYDHAAA